MNLIELTQSRVAIIDDEDFEWLSKWSWYYRRDKKTGYAQRSTGTDPHRKRFLMHVEILKRHGLWKRGKEVDHTNTCGCDNRKENLRMVTSEKQSANRRRRSDNTSGITGVHWHKFLNKWRSCIGVKRKLILLGDFIDKKDAIAARRQAEIKYFGEYRHNSQNLCPLWKTGQCLDCAERPRELELTEA